MKKINYLNYMKYSYEIFHMKYSYENKTPLVEKKNVSKHYRKQKLYMK